MLLDFRPEGPDAGTAYRWLTALVVPRPIAWVGTVGPDGTHNLAPHSFFTVASPDPPVVSFTSVGTKDSLSNILATRDYTISIAGRRLLEAVNATSARLDHGTSEFDHAGLTAAESRLVAAPHVAEAPAHLECRLRDVVDFGQSKVVFGDVLAARVDEAVLDPDHPTRVDMRALDPVGRLAGPSYGALGDLIHLERPG